MVLTAHVHNYQRIEKKIVDAGPTPFLVAGFGGYYHLHGMNGTDGDVDSQTGATLIGSVHDAHGYSTLTVGGKTISVVAKTAVAATPDDNPDVNDIDTFSYPTRLIKLADNDVVSL